MKARFLFSVLLALSIVFSGILGIGHSSVASAAETTPLKVVSYLYDSWNPGVNVNQLSSGIWEVFMPTSTTDMTLVPATGSTSGIAGMISALHSANKPIEFSVFAPWGENGYNAVFTNQSLRQALFQQIVGVFNKYNFDGVNFDWECDNASNLNATDITNFYAQLYAILNPMGKTISATENYGKVVMTPAAANYLSYIGLMVYDCGQPVTWFGTLAEANTDLNRWANAGFPKSKLLLGISFAARYSSGGGWFNYRYIVDTYNPAPSANLAGGLAYNGIDLVTQKAQLVRDNGFGGVFLYEANMDKLNDSRSLLQHIYDTFGGVSQTPVVSQYTVSLSVSGQGTTSPVPGTRSVNSGTTMSVTATPSTGYTFSRWTGDVSSTANPISFQVNSNMNVQAVFNQVPVTPLPSQEETYQLILSTQGQGTTSPAPGTTSVSGGTTISVTAIPSTGYAFSQWTGDVSGTANPISFQVNSNMNVQAVFNQVPVTLPTPSGETYQLTVSTQGQGTTNLAPGTYAIQANQQVTMTATPAAGWTFRSWSWPGNDPNYSGWPENPITWNLVESISIIAVFDQIAIPVQLVNSPPTLNYISNKSVTVGQTLNFTITGTDVNGDKLTYSGTSLPSGATLNPQTGVFSWAPRRSQVGSFTVSFKCSDGSLTDMQTVTITVKRY